MTAPQNTFSMNHYDTELLRLEETYKSALKADVSGLKNAILGASDSSLIGIGSGGSFTVASLLCNLHETYTGCISRPSTPLEVICNPTLALSSPVFLVSAEGKNPDIIEALKRARHHSARAIHLLTNCSDSPLMKTVAELTDIDVNVFELVGKDGYLATNSLLMDAVLVARAYAELDRSTKNLSDDFQQLRLKEQTISSWLEDIDSFTRQTVERRGLIITYSPGLRAIAADLESKLSESALLYCQLADIRSFAHGRHLWLADRTADCAILALVDPSLDTLWSKMLELIPEHVPTVTMRLAGVTPSDLIAGLVAEMRLVASIARYSGSDPGCPQVPQFGRDLYYLDISSYVAPPKVVPDHAERTKFDVLGARWPSIGRFGSMTRALDSFRAAIEEQVFRAIVFDYDGTLCPPQLKDTVPPQAVLNQIIRLSDANIVMAVASGRGGSMRDRLREGLPEQVWKKVHLGLYNGGWISDCATTAEPEDATSEFLFHVLRIMNRLRTIGVPIVRIKCNLPYQISVRFVEGTDTERMWYVMADALLQAGLDVAHMVRSKHSVDVLADGVSKSRLVVHLIQQFGLLPEEVLTLGDQGAWPGNDAALLDHRYSLSVDLPSRRLDRGWKLAPSHKRYVDATLWYLDRIQILKDGRFHIRFDENMNV
ncbi:MAG: HAD family hydrolase [Rhodocyclaceae bacterium]|nr:HAD family hydrolase [Rhodocyclaceae bacterium]